MSCLRVLLVVLIAGTGRAQIVTSGFVNMAGKGQLISVVNSPQAMFTATGEALTGNIVTDSASLLTAGLNASSLTGAITGNVDLTMNQASTWTLTGDSMMGELTLNSGSSVNFNASSSGSFKTLTVKSLHGDGTGSFDMSVNLSALKGDQINDTGASTGAFTLNVSRQNQSMSPPKSSVLKLVITPDGV